MEYKVFYSWQSDLPNPTNRGLIGEALETAAKNLTKDDTVSVDPVVDRDTKGTAGSPEIASTIFKKIEADQVFVADVSIINGETVARPTPNPNVLLELGYAARHLGWDRIVMVFNSAFGRIEDLPFDLRMRRVITFEASVGNKEARPASRGDLAKNLERALRDIIEFSASIVGEVAKIPPLVELATDAVEHGKPNAPLAVRRYLDGLLEALASASPIWDSNAEPDDQLLDSIEKTTDLVADFSNLCEVIATLDAAEPARAIYDWFELLLKEYDLPRGFSGESRSTDFDFYKFMGGELFTSFVSKLLKHRRYETIGKLLSKSYYPDNISVDRGKPTMPWYSLSKPVTLLTNRNNRLGLNRISVHSDLLNTRHTEGSLGKAMPMSELMAGDLFLFMRGLVEDKTRPNWAAAWIPWSALYLKRAPRFLLEATSQHVFREMMPAFGTASWETTAAEIREKLPSLGKVFGAFWDGYEYDPSTLASQP